MKPGSVRNWVLEDLKSSAQALEPYLDDLVLVGGLVPLCYRELFDSEEGTQCLATADIDWAVPGKLPIRQSAGADSLLLAAGFRPMFSHGDVPPSAKYQHERFQEKSLAPIYLEFITDRRGGPISRSGETGDKVSIQEGFAVPALPYVKILLEETIGFSLRRLGFSELKEEFKIQIPHPANYVFHKILVAERRSRSQKREKDWGNVFETAVMTQGIRDEMRDRLSNYEKSKQFPPAWIKSARKLAQDRFGEVFSDGPVAVTRLVSKAGYRMSEAGVFEVMSAIWRSSGF